MSNYRNSYIFTGAAMRLVTVHHSILSSYQPRSRGGGTGGPRETLLRLDQLGPAGQLEEHAAASLLRVQSACTAQGIDLRITDALRSREAQQAARSRWWRHKYRNGPRAPYAAEWGKSWHGCGLAVDTDVDALGSRYDDHAAIMRAEGWRQVADGLRPGADEAWHWQYPAPGGLTVEDAHRALGLLT